MRTSLVIVALVAGCGGPADPPRLDAEHLPAELRGLMPGVATEPEVAAALGDATATRDEAYGGRYRVETSGEPAIRVESEQHRIEAWLMHITGQPRVGSLFVPLARPCTQVMADFGDRVRSGECSETGRRFARNERAYCSRTPDGRYFIELACFDPPTPRLSVWVDVVPAKTREYLIRPL